MVLSNYNQPPCFWLPVLFGSIHCHIIPYCSASLLFDGFIYLDSYDTIAMKLKKRWKMLHIDCNCLFLSVSKQSFTKFRSFVSLIVILQELTRQILLQIYTENMVNSAGQLEENSWQALVFVPKDSWYIIKASSFISNCLRTLYYSPGSHIEP